MKRERRGFTITELLLVIGILVILLGASVPGIVAIQRRLEQRQLDDFAREIFVAAQNQMSARAVAGTLNRVEDASQINGEFSWLTDNEAVETLLEGDAMVILEAGSHCMIKYNDDTATVLEVYYAREPMDEDTVTTGVYSDENANNINRRKEDHIGYFMGDDAEAGKVAYMPTPLLTVDNGEELKVSVSIPSTTELGSDISYKVSLTVQELKANGQPKAESSFQTEPETGTGSTAFSYDETVILDSLAPNKQFYQISGGKVTPGASIMVTTTVSYLSGGSSKLAYLASSASARSNSLFAGLDNSGAAKIANGRHLQNLNAGISRVSGITAAVQTEIVNWTLHENGTQDYYTRVYGQTYNNANPLYFQPIQNSQLSSYDGKNNEIQCLDIKLPMSGSAANAGLFASMPTGAQLKNIAILCPSISNPSLSNIDTVSTGALAGHLTRATVTNCRCYGANGFVFGNSKYVGGLIGRADNCTVTNSFAQLFYVESDCGKTVGGLIGSAAGGRVEYCYANSGVLRVNTGTGLNEWEANYGLRSPGKPSQGYAPGSIGGLIGYGAENLEINNCYSCGFAGVGDTACGILGKGSGIQKAMTNSYSVLSYGSGVSTAYGISEHNTYYDNNTAYWLGGRSAGLTIAGKNNYAAVSLLARPGNWISAGVSYPYGGTLSATSAVYPYPMISNLPHYGDWPSPEAVPTKAYIFSGLTSEGSGAYTPYTVNNGNYYVTLEQIPGTINYNQKTITAYAMLNVNGTESTPHAVVWQVYTDSGADDGWTTITGSSINISSGSKVRATLHRNSTDNTYAGNNTGGSIALTAIDVDEYASSVDIALRVRSVLSGEANEWARVNVKIMPQLQFVDSAISISTVNSFSGVDVDVIANRKKNDVVDDSYGWTPQWQIVRNTDAPATVTGVTSNTNIMYRQHYAWGSNAFDFVTLNWGPYSCSGTITARQFAGGIISSCTGDALISVNSDGDASYYFIIEKGSQRSFSFSWTSTVIFGRTPDLTNNIGDLDSNIVSFSDPPTLDDGSTGSQTYVVTGNNYNDSTPLNAWWHAERVYDTTSYCDIYVVGLESDEVDKITAKTTDRGGSSVSFKVKAHFPDGILSDKARTYTWWTDSNEYIGVAADAGDPSLSHTTVLKANTSGEDINVNVYCRYSVGDTRFTYTQVFTVTIPSMTPPTFEKCLIEDLVFMTDIAAEGAQTSWIDPVISETDCRLVAGSSIYIKTAAPCIRSGTEPANYSYYDVVLSESSNDIEIHPFTGSDHITYYRIDAAAAPAANTATGTITAGPWSGTLNFNIVQPSLIGGAYTLDEGGQQATLTANDEGFYECAAGTDMYLQLTGVPDLSGLAVSGLDDAKLTATIPALDYTTGSYNLCLSAAAVTEQTDLTLTITSARYPTGLAVKIRIVPPTIPEPAPAPAPPEKSPEQTTQTEPKASTPTAAPSEQPSPAVFDSPSPAVTG